MTTHHRPAHWPPATEHDVQPMPPDTAPLITRRTDSFPGACPCWSCERARATTPPADLRVIRLAGPGGLVFFFAAQEHGAAAVQYITRQTSPEFALAGPLLGRHVSVPTVCRFYAEPAAHHARLALGQQED